MKSCINSKNILKTFLFFFCAIIFIVVLISFLLPLSKNFSNFFIQEQKFSTRFTFSRIAKITGFTLLQAICSVMISVLAGFPAAYLLAKKKIFGKKILSAMGSVPLCIPPLIVVLGYISTFGMNGVFNRLLMQIFNLKEAPLRFLYSFWGIVFVQGFYNFPLIMTTLADSWATVDLSQEDSARILGAGESKIFFGITLPQIFPALVSGCIPVFIYCFFSFMIVLLFGAPGTSTLELEIYHAGRSSLDFGLVSRLAFIETFVAVAVIFLWTLTEKKLRRNHQLTFNRIEKTSVAGIKKLPVIFYFLILALCFFLPLVSIFIGSLTSRTGGINHLSFEGWKRVFKLKEFFPSIKNTLLTAVSTALVCTVCGFFYSTVVRLSKVGPMTSVFNTVSLLPMAVSSVAIGIGMSAVVKKSSPLILVAAQSALTWPFAFRQIYSHMTKIPQTVLDSASILSKNRLDVVYKIIVPYSWRGIVSAAGFCFAISAGDATLPLVLSMQKYTTLSLFTYRLAGSYKFTEACVSGLLLGIICSVVFGFSKKIGEKNGLS